MPGSLPVTRISFSGAPGLLLAFGLVAARLCWPLPHRPGATPPALRRRRRGLQPPSGIDAGSPLSLGSGPVIPRVGIPPGSTEIATPGISPAAPLSGPGSTSGNT
jgi:hypothetical protein